MPSWKPRRLRSNWLSITAVREFLYAATRWSMGEERKGAECSDVSHLHGRTCMSNTVLSSTTCFALSAGRKTGVASAVEQPGVTHSAASTQCSTRGMHARCALRGFLTTDHHVAAAVDQHAVPCTAQKPLQISSDTSGMHNERSSHS